MSLISGLSVLSRDNDVATQLIMIIGGCRLPAHGFPCHANLGVQLVHLLKAETLGLIDHEPDEEDAEEAAREPHEEDLGLQVGIALPVVDEVRGRVGDGPVQQPVRRRGYAEGLGAGREGEDLARDNPAEGTPGRGEEGDVDASEGHRRPLPSQARHVDLAVVVLAGRHRAGDGDDQLRDAHADGSPEEQGTSAPFVDGVHARNGSRDVDGGGDHLDNEAAGDSRVLEVLGPVKQLAKVN